MAAEALSCKHTAHVQCPLVDCLQDCINNVNNTIHVSALSLARYRTLEHSGTYHIRLLQGGLYRLSQLTRFSRTLCFADCVSCSSIEVLDVPDRNAKSMK
jgi:hypothetical protein